MKNLNRNLIAVAVPLLLVTTAACGGGGSGSSGGDEKKLRVAFANYSESSQLHAPVAAGAKEAGKAAGIDVHVYDNNGNAEKTLENARTIAQDKPDVVVEYSADPSIGKSLSTVFERAAIPCIALNVITEGCAWANGPSSDLGTAAGEILVDWVRKNSWDGSNTTVLIVNLPKFGKEVNDLVRHQYVTFASQVEGFKRIKPEEFTESTTRIADNAVVVDGGDGAADSTFQVVQSALQNIPKSQNIVFMTISDNGSLGGWRAIDEAGRGDKAVLVGLGGSESALKQLQSTEAWIGEVDALMTVWGWYTVAMAVAVHEGVEPPKLTALPFLKLTKENLSEYYNLDDLSQPAKLPEADESTQYLWKTGVLQKYGNG